MKTLEQHYKSNQTNFWLASIPAILLSIGSYMVQHNTIKALTLLAVITLWNFVFWGVRNVLTYIKDRDSTRDRREWEAAMLNAINLANAAGAYGEYDNPNIMSAYHDAVTRCQQEGVKKGYLILGQL